MDTPQPPISSPEPLTRRERRELKRQEQRNNQSSAQRQKTLRNVSIWGGLLILVALGIYALMRAQPDTSTIQAAGTNELTDHDWVKGIRDSKALLVEYSDFQCPACATYQPIIKQLMDEYQDRITFVYRHFPLRQIHQNAQISAQAAEAAGLQNKFWEMHDLLFDKQDEWASLGNPRDTFKGYAQSLSLNTDQFMTDLESQAAKDQVNADERSGVKANVQGTPTFFLNGVKKTFRSYDDMKTAVEEALQ